MTQEGFKRKLTAILSADVKGYSRLMDDNEEATVLTLTAYRSAMSELVQQHQGRVVDATGDNLMADFASVVDAVNCAVEIQRELLQRNNELENNRQMEFRIGVNLGDVIEEEGRLYGDGVNITARIEGLAEAGGICISGSAFDQIENKLGLDCEFLGEHDVKNISRPVRVYRITKEPGAATGPENEKETLFTPDEPSMENRTNNIKDTQHPLLATKLYIPQLRPNLVQRTPLIDQLNKGIHRKLTLISAPAGFGKTTLLGEWISHSDIPAAWISLDKSDGDSVQFTHYMVAALQSIKPGFGESVLSLLQSPQRPSIETILTNLIKEITDLSMDLVLVFDDYHSIDTENIHQIMRTLLDYLPARVHLVISTRVDPPLPLARLRVSNQLSELRTVDLCFTTEETTAFFNQIMNLQLSSDDIAILDSRTEGWIAGLQLAAISMQGRDDLSAFINSFAGDDRHIVDYLVEEVLSLQAEPIQKFLLQTSILNRLSESLCNFVTGEKNSQSILDQLEKANLFIVPLDDKRHWYRYHHLFADLLQQRLRQSGSDYVNELHDRASKWYEKNGLKDEAINHALAAHNFERASHLIGGFLQKAWEFDDRMLEWHKRLPVEFIHKDPELSFFNAWMLYENGQYAAAEENLQVVENLIKSPKENVRKKPSKTKDLQPEDQAELRGKVAAVRAFMALFRNKVPDVISFAEKALEHLHQSKSSWRSIAVFALGKAYYSNGEIAKANKKYQEAADESKTNGNYYIYLTASLGLTEIKRRRGDLSGAIVIFEELLKTSQEKGLSKSAMMGWLYLSWGEVLGDLNNTNEALQYIQQGIEFSKQVNDSAMIGSAYLRLAKVLFIKGDISGAEAIFQEVEKLENNSDIPLYIVDFFENLKVRIWLQKGRIKPALQWMRDQELSENGTNSHLPESKQILFSRILFAQGKLDKALEHLRQLTKTPEVLLIQAKILKSQGELSEAISSLKEAISLTENGGFISMYVEEGPDIAELLQILLDENKELPRAYVNKLLSAFRLTKLVKTDDGIVERLSERELEVLRLIAAGLPNKTIVNELFISLSTVKTHIRNIYSKLNVNNRTKAIAKANELNLL